MGRSESSEMYLETIYLLEKEKGHAHGVEISEKLGVSKASVTKAMKALKSKGYVEHEAYGSICLTGKGWDLAESIYLKHQIITQYLRHSLKISEYEAAVNACKMEHILTDEALNAMETYNREKGVLN